MPDNVGITTGVDASVATDLIGGIHHARCKVEFGPDGAASDVHEGNPLPVQMFYSLPVSARMLRAAINATAAGNNALVAGVAAQTIRVWKLFMVAITPVNFKFKDAGTDFHPYIPLGAGSSFTLDLDGEPWFITSVANALNLDLQAAGQVVGRIYYTQGA